MVHELDILPRQFTAGGNSHLLRLLCCIHFLHELIHISPLQTGAHLQKHA